MFEETSSVAIGFDALSKFRTLMRRLPGKAHPALEPNEPHFLRCRNFFCRFFNSGSVLPGPAEPSKTSLAKVGKASVYHARLARTLDAVEA